MHTTKQEQKSNVWNRNRSAAREINNKQQKTGHQQTRQQQKQTVASAAGVSEGETFTPYTWARPVANTRPMMPSQYSANHAQPIHGKSYPATTPQIMSSQYTANHTKPQHGQSCPANAQPIMPGQSSPANTWPIITASHLEQSQLQRKLPIMTTLDHQISPTIPNHPDSWSNQRGCVGPISEKWEVIGPILHGTGHVIWPYTSENIPVIVHEWLYTINCTRVTVDEWL